MLKKFLAVSAISLALAAPAQAHKFWIEPNEFYYYAQTKEQDAKVQEKLSADFIGGDTYFNADIGVNVNEVKGFVFRLNDPKAAPVKFGKQFMGDTKVSVEAELNSTGTYLLEASAKEKPTACYGDKPEVLCFYVHAKTFVSLYQTSAGFDTPRGHTLEIVPLSHPNTVFKGDTLNVKVLYQGKPLADAEITAISQNYRMKEHGEAPTKVKTNKDGVASIQFDMANRWLIAVAHKTESKTKDVKTDYHAATLMLQVEEPWVKELAK